MKTHGWEPLLAVSLFLWLFVYLQLYLQHHNQSYNILITCQSNAKPLSYYLSIPPFNCLAATNLLLVSIDLPILDILSGERHGTPLQYSCLENPMYGGA